MTLTRDTTRLRSHAAAAALAVVAVAAPAASAQSGPPGCVGDTKAAQVQQLPGPPVRFGINARAAARVRMADGPLVRLTRRYRRCPA
jgi:hypothetical protein